MEKGLFIVLEGPDGSGKTTVEEGLQQKFEAAGLSYLISREPGGPPLSEKIRDIILDPRHEEMDPRCEALLYAASRAQHVSETILPALQEGKLVLSSRYVLSSLAYQGVGRGLGIPEVRAINDFATQGLEADLILFLDVNPVNVLDRKARVADQDRLEGAGKDFHQKVYRGYQEALNLFQQVERIDASQSKEAVIEQCWLAIQARMEGEK